MVVIRMLSHLWGRAEKGRELVVTQAVMRSAETKQADLAGVNIAIESQELKQQRRGRG